MGIADKLSPTVKLGVVGVTVPVFILYVLALVGCISPGLSNVYLFLLKVNEVTLRVGYFAMCAVDLAANSTSSPRASNSTSNSTAADGTICVSSFGLNASDLSFELFGDEGDVVPILDLAITLQGKILIPLVLVAAFLLLFGAILFALVKVFQQKLSDPAAYDPMMKQLGIFKPATLATIWMAVCFAFAAAVASTMGIGALNFIIPVLATNITVTGGRILQSLQYIAFIFAALFALAATLFLPEPLEQPGVAGEGYPQDEKNLDQESFDQSQMQEGQEQQQYAEGQYPEGQYPEGQYPEGQYQEGQYPEGQQQYNEAEYAQQQQQYAEGGEYAQEQYAAQQQQQYQQPQQQQQYQQPQQQQQYQQQQQQQQQYQQQ